jgi:hypothetical protein
MLEPEQTDSTQPDDVRTRDPRRYLSPSRAVAVVPWRSTIREFLVIVAGILSALAAQTLWTRHQDQEMERDYLLQLLTDTRENEHRANDAIEHEELIRAATASAMTVLEGTGPLPPPDSMMRWIATTAGASEFRPLVGTYRALVGTGELHLIRNDSLRAILTEYSAEVESESERLRGLRNTVISQAGPIAREIPFIRGAFIQRIKPLTSADIVRMRSNTEAAVVLFTLQAANDNRLNGLRPIRDATVRLRKALEAEPALRAGH